MSDVYPKDKWIRQCGNCLSSALARSRQQNGAQKAGDCCEWSSFSPSGGDSNRYEWQENDTQELVKALIQNPCSPVCNTATDQEGRYVSDCCWLIALITGHHLYDHMTWHFSFHGGLNQYSYVFRTWPTFALTHMHRAHGVFLYQQLGKLLCFLVQTTQFSMHWSTTYRRNID